MPALPLPRHWPRFQWCVATFLPKSIHFISSHTITPGFLFSISVELQGFACELINVYLHPNKVSSLSHSLLGHLRSPHSRKHAIRIVGGDFNRLQQRIPRTFSQILTELNASHPPCIPTYRQLNGHKSSLDFFLIQLDSAFSTVIGLPKAFTFWPSYHNTGHGIHVMKFPRPQLIEISDTDTPAATIPTTAFYLPPSTRVNNPTSSIPSLAPLMRSLLSLSPCSLLKAKSVIWSWWRTQKTRSLDPDSPPFKHVHTLKRKLMRASSLHLTIPRCAWEWLVSHFPAQATIPPIIQDSFVYVPTLLLSRLLTQYEIIHASRSHHVPRSQFTTSPSHTWSKCRSAAPKIAKHTGIVRDSQGQICSSTAALDRALRATRAFWQERPCSWDPAWAPLLSSYSSASSPFPSCPPPTADDLYHSVVTSPDSSPGADGIPYAAWRVCPSVSVEALSSHFQDILTGTAPPPTQALVFIPKADKGEYADNYRPLGLPNTADRLIDRAAYINFCQALMGALHPAQALLNSFREPQANYLEVQNFLDGSDDCNVVLLSDLAKAFERVNPHWIIRVLIARSSPYWVVRYCRYILFGRKVLHKIHGHFRPALPIHTGVDMGRAFSVLLFCVAMDPWYHHVHRIPRVIVNKGYMDDNATGGHGLEWIAPTESLIQSLSTAGFIVLGHSCYQVVASSRPYSPHPHFSIGPQVTHGHPSLFQAFDDCPPSPMLQIRSGNRAVDLPQSMISRGEFISCPSCPQVMAFLHTATCVCKCKTFLIPNRPFSVDNLIYLDATPFGAKIVSPSATMLGLFLHSPHQSVLPRVSDTGETLSALALFSRQQIESQQTQKALAGMTQRTRAGIALGLSFRERTLFLSFYVLSLPHYHHSVLLPSASLISTYYQLVRRTLCKRPWMQARFLPGVVSYLRLGILHCPRIFLSSSLLGFALRAYGEIIVSWLCGVSPLPPLPSQLSSGLRKLRQMLVDAEPYNPIHYTELCYPFLTAQSSFSSLSRKITSVIKLYLNRRVQLEAREFLRDRLSKITWLGHSSSSTFDTLHSTPLKVIPSFSRLAILRWLIDSEADMHFRLRPHVTRTAPCRCGCGELSSIYPDGFSGGSLAESHLDFPVTWVLLCDHIDPSPFDRFIDATFHPPLPPQSAPIWLSRDGTQHPSLSFLPTSLQDWARLPCVLCGRGDNSVQHWLRFCPVPALAGSYFLNRKWAAWDWFLHSHHTFGHKALIAALWVGTRQLVHERAGLPPPSLTLPSSPSPQPLLTVRHLLDRVYSLIPAPFRPSGYTPSAPIPTTNGCYRDSVSFRTLSLESEGLPIFYGPAPTTAVAVPADFVLGVFPLSSALPKKLFTFQYQVPRPPNCTIQFKLCSCGKIHGYLTTLAPLDAGSILYVGDPTPQSSDFVLQFDGGAFRELKVGGAGVILWSHSNGILTFVDSLAIPISPCSDAAHAETVGALYAVILASKHFSSYTPSRIIIKGDNRPLIDFMTHTGKFRRPDLQRLLSEAQHLLAFRLPPVQWSYTPREFNKCADYLAGAARDLAKQSLPHTTDFSDSLLPFFLPLPPSLLSFTGQPVRPTMDTPTSSFTFPEIISLSPSLLPLVFRQSHRSPAASKYLRALVKGSHTLTTLSVLYSPTAPDSKGRLNPKTIGAQKLPKSFRSLLFGNTHTEIDLVGSHYQLFQRLALSHLNIVLPGVQTLRFMIRTDIDSRPSSASLDLASAPKALPTILLNSTLEATLDHFRLLGYWPSPSVLAALRAIAHAKPLLWNALDAHFGPRDIPALTAANRPFYTLEHPETLWLKAFVVYLSAHFTFDSLIWLHDGIWISPAPAPPLLLAANRHASASLGFSDPLDLRVTPCSPAYSSAHASLLAGTALPVPPPPPTSAAGPAPRPSAPFDPPAARSAFQRMLFNNAFPRGVINLD